MGKAVLVLYNDAMRARAIDWIRRAKPESRVTFQGPKRSLDQNAKMWAMLSEISERVDHHGRKYLPSTWKSLFLSAWGQEVQYVPALTGPGVIPIVYRSSDLSREEMASLIEFIEAWAAEFQFQFNGPKRLEPPPPPALEDFR